MRRLPLLCFVFVMLLSVTGCSALIPPIRYVDEGVKGGRIYQVRKVFRVLWLPVFSHYYIDPDLYAVYRSQLADEHCLLHAPAAADCTACRKLPGNPLHLTNGAAEDERDLNSDGAAGR